MKIFWHQYSRIVIKKGYRTLMNYEKFILRRYRISFMTCLQSVKRFYFIDIFYFWNKFMTHELDAQEIY